MINNINNIAEIVSKELEAVKGELNKHFANLSKSSPEKSKELKEAFDNLTKANTEEEKSSALNTITKLCQSI